jgi:recombination protein RecA
MDINELKARLQKAAKGVHIEVLSESNIANVSKFLDGPSYDVNRILTGSLFKGLPEKSVTCLVAPEGVFKSSLMAIAAADAQRKGYKPIIFDTEGAFSKEFCERWGVDPDNMLHIYTIYVEEITTLLGDFIDNKDQDIFLILDSLGGLESTKIIRDTTSGDHEAKADQGGLARKIKRMLKMFVSVVKSQNGMGMFSGHWYGKPDSYGAAEDIGGGKYVKLAADIIISMKKTSIYANPAGKTIKEKGDIVGSEISACTLKNRFYPPFQEAKIQINYKDGINKFAGIMDMALTCGIIQQSGAWYSYQGERLGQGIVKATDAVITNDAISKSILNELEVILKTTGYSNVNNEVLNLARELVEQDNNNFKDTE